MRQLTLLPTVTNDGGGLIRLKRDGVMKRRYIEPRVFYSTTVGFITFVLRAIFIFFYFITTWASIWVNNYDGFFFFFGSGARDGFFFFFLKSVFSWHLTNERMTYFSMTSFCFGRDHVVLSKSGSQGFMRSLDPNTLWLETHGKNQKKKKTKKTKKTNRKGLSSRTSHNKYA